MVIDEVGELSLKAPPEGILALEDESDAVSRPLQEPVDAIRSPRPCREAPIPAFADGEFAIAVNRMCAIAILPVRRGVDGREHPTGRGGAGDDNRRVLEV